MKTVELLVLLIHRVQKKGPSFKVYLLLMCILMATVNAGYRAL